VVKHFAFFIEGDEVKWTYGFPQDSAVSEDEIHFQKTTVHFIQSLQSIGRELYSEGVASIKLDKPSEAHTSLVTLNELFIVNLSDQFFFIISDLEVTSRLIKTVEIPFEVEQIITAVLVGQAAILYATLLTEQDKYDYDTDRIFRRILILLEIDKRYDLANLVDKGRCSLSPLDITELLLFHYMLRNYLESSKIRVSLSANPWAIMVDKSGTDIPLSWQPPKDPHVLGNFLGAIFSYVQGLFGVRPSTITFGGHEIIILQFYGGQKYILAVSNPQSLFINPNFLFSIKEIPPLKFEDIKIAVKRFLIDYLLEKLAKSLSSTEFDEILVFLENDADISQLFSTTHSKAISGEKNFKKKKLKK
jgi:hypothetical protein